MYIPLHCISGNNRTLRHVKNGVLCIMIYKPISVDAYGFTDKSQTVVRIYTEGGGMITAKQCPTDQPLYCTRDGHFFSLTKFGLREVKPCFAVPRDPRVCHTRYPFMRQFGNRTYMKAIDLRAALIAANDINLNGASALEETRALRQLIASANARIEELESPRNTRCPKE